MAGLGKQAKILSEAQIRAALGHVEQSRYPERDRVMVLLSVKAGMRAKGDCVALLGHADGCRGRDCRCHRPAECGEQGQAGRSDHPHASGSEGSSGGSKGHARQ